MLSLVYGLDSLTSSAESPLAMDYMPVSTPVKTVFRVCHLTRCYFRLLWNRSTYTPATLASADILNFTLGNSSFVRYAAQACLIWQASMRAIETMQDVKDACDDCYDAYLCTYPIPADLMQEKLSEESSQKYYVAKLAFLPQPVFHVILRIEIALQATWVLIQAMWALSVALFDLFDSYVMDRLSQYVTITGAITSGQAILDELMSDPGKVASDIEHNPQFFDSIFRFVGSKQTATDMSTAVREHIQNLTKAGKIAVKAGAEIARTGQEASFDASFMLAGFSQVLLFQEVVELKVHFKERIWMVKKLILIRHAEVEDGYSDSTVSISDLGRLTQKKMSEYLLQEGVSPTQILHSPLLRAKQTAEILKEVFHKPLQEEEALGLFFDEEKLLKILSNAPDNSIIFMVGHAPTLINFALFLCQKNDRLPPSIARSGALLISFDEKVTSRSGHFERYFSPDLVSFLKYQS